jgi:hypothetical protein
MSGQRLNGLGLPAIKLDAGSHLRWSGLSGVNSHLIEQLDASPVLRSVAALGRSRFEG